MSIFSRKNQYLGINAHYNSYLQHEPGGWPTFHTPYLTHLVTTLNQVLPDDYYARVERSLQIAKPADTVVVKPDVGVYRRTSSSPQRPSVGASAVASPTYVTDAVNTFPDIDMDWEAGMIYQVVKGGKDRAVTRIELFSPSNKPPHSYHLEYLVKRLDSLESGIHLVELDYLHETRSPFFSVALFQSEGHLPDYSAGLDEAYPYYIAVTPSQPTELQTYFYCFRVDEPFPVLPLPLDGDQYIAFDFEQPYQLVYTADRFAHLTVDYSQPPLGFESYTPLDRAGIERRMQAVQKAAAAGMDLEQGPFAIEPEHG